MKSILIGLTFFNFCVIMNEQFIHEKGEDQI